MTLEEILSDCRWPFEDDYEGWEDMGDSASWIEREPVPTGRNPFMGCIPQPEKPP